MNDPITYRHWAIDLAPKAAPALATTTVLILGRMWNANGAEHSVGNAALMVVLATGAATAGAFASGGRSGDSVIAGTAFAASGGLALAGVAGYADGLSLPVLLWALATAVAYGLAARYWRTDRRETVAHQRQTLGRREDHAHVERGSAARRSTDRGSPFRRGLRRAARQRPHHPRRPPRFQAARHHGRGTAAAPHHRREDPMTGPEHYLRAEEYLQESFNNTTGSDLEKYYLAAAQAHATLALAAATAFALHRLGVNRAEWKAWQDAAWTPEDNA